LGGNRGWCLKIISQKFIADFYLKYEPTGWVVASWIFISGVSFEVRIAFSVVFGISSGDFSPVVTSAEVVANFSFKLERK
jgi:hypothetical protein